MKVIAKRSDLSSPDVLRKIMRENIHFILKQREAPLEIPKNGLYTVMVVGVNGTGKTTTIGKIANEFKGRGCSVMLAAADTFRAAAIEQLEVWGERGASPSSSRRWGPTPRPLSSTRCRPRRPGGSTSCSSTRRGGSIRRSTHGGAQKGQEDHGPGVPGISP